MIQTDIIPLKSYVEALSYNQPPSQVNYSIPLTTSMTSVPNFTSNIMAYSTQNFIPTHVS